MFRIVRIAALVCLTGAANADATTEIATTARGLFSNVRVVGQPLTLVGPIASVSGRTSPGYSLTGGVASLSNTIDLATVSGITATLGLNSGAITTAAAANGTTPADTDSGSASAVVNGLDISLFTTTSGVPSPVLELTAGRLESQTNASIVGQVVSLTGGSLFTNLNLSVRGTSILSLGSNAQVAANFVAYDSDGLKVILNQQFVSHYDNTRVLITNAVGISFSNYLLDGRSLSGGITVGQSLAEYLGTDPIPEPAIWAQMVAGFALTGLAVRRRRLHAGA